LDLKLSTQDVKIVDTNSSRDSVLPKAGKQKKVVIEKSIEAGSDTNKSADDPFQDEWKQLASGAEV
jgi:hypothetical protein